MEWYGDFHSHEATQLDGLYGKTIYKWMSWGYPHGRKPPYRAHLTILKLRTQLYWIQMSHSNYPSWVVMIVGYTEPIRGGHGSDDLAIDSNWMVVIPLNCDRSPIACGSYSSNPGHILTRSVHLSSILCLDTHYELNIFPPILHDINLISLQNHHQAAPLVPYFIPLLIHRSSPQLTLRLRKLLLFRGKNRLPSLIALRIGKLPVFNS